MTGPDVSGHSVSFLTVGQLRAELEGLADDAQIVVTSSPRHTYDEGIVQTLHSRLIPWEHDCMDAPVGHKPGQDCPTVMALELWLEGCDQLGLQPPARAGQQSKGTEQ